MPQVRTLMLIPNRLIGGDEQATMPFVSIRPGLLGGWAIYDRRFVLGLLPRWTCSTQQELQEWVNRWSHGMED